MTVFCDNDSVIGDTGVVNTIYIHFNYVFANLHCLLESLCMR